MAQQPLSLSPPKASAKEIPSPFILFIMCIERLSHRIDSAVNNCLWTPIKISARISPISHLLFDDDTILYAAVDSISYNTISAIFKLFELVSGQKINQANSKFFSKSAHVRTKDRAIHDLNIQKGHKFEKYLGFPIFMSKTTKYDFQFFWITLRIDWLAEKIFFLILQGELPLSGQLLTASPTMICFSYNSRGMLLKNGSLWVKFPMRYNYNPM